MREDDAEEESESELEFTIVPLSKVGVDLEADEVEDEVGDVTMEDPTDEDPPELKRVTDPGVVLVLQLKYRAVPRELRLVLLAVAVGQQHHERHDEHRRDDEGETFELEVGHEDHVERRVGELEELVGAGEVVVCAFSHGLVVGGADFVFAAVVVGA